MKNSDFFIPYDVQLDYRSGRFIIIIIFRCIMTRVTSIFPLKTNIYDNEDKEKQLNLKVCHISNENI